MSEENAMENGFLLMALPVLLTAALIPAAILALGIGLMGWRRRR